MPLWAWISIGLVCLWGVLEIHYRHRRAEDHDDNKDFIRENRAVHKYLWATIVRPWRKGDR